MSSKRVSPLYIAKFNKIVEKTREAVIGLADEHKPRLLVLFGSVTRKSQDYERARRVLRGGNKYIQERAHACAKLAELTGRKSDLNMARRQAENASSGYMSTSIWTEITRISGEGADWQKIIDSSWRILPSTCRNEEMKECAECLAKSRRVKWAVKMVDKISLYDGYQYRIELLATIYAVTGNPKYLEWARKEADDIHHNRGKTEAFVTIAGVSHSILDVRKARRFALDMRWQNLAARELAKLAQITHSPTDYKAALRAAECIAPGNSEIDLIRRDLATAYASERKWKQALQVIHSDEAVALKNIAEAMLNAGKLKYAWRVAKQIKLEYERNSTLARVVEAAVQADQVELARRVMADISRASSHMKAIIAIVRNAGDLDDIDRACELIESIDSMDDAYCQACSLIELVQAMQERIMAKRRRKK